MSAVTPEMLGHFAKVIAAELGIVYAETNFYQLEGRLIEAAVQLGFPSPQAFFDATRRGLNTAQRELLLELALNNETSFFRDRPAFDAVGRAAVEIGRLPGRAPGPLRVWSAACSFGQEPYSLAMLFQGLLPRLPGNRVEITATDVSARVLACAASGRFTKLQAGRGLEPAELARHFTAETDHVVARPELRQGMTFKQQNLLHDFAKLGTFDLILCRNVLIYQTVESKREVVARLAQRLAPGGMLLLGAAESLFGVSDAFEAVRDAGATLYRKPAPAATRQAG